MTCRYVVRFEAGPPAPRWRVYDSEACKRERPMKPFAPCTNCGASKSPEWRLGPLGPRTLCNKCGLRYRKEQSRVRSIKERMSIGALLVENNCGNSVPDERSLASKGS